MRIHEEDILSREPLGPLEKRHCLWRLGTDHGHSVEIDAVYAPDGGYVGNLETAQQLLDRGIVPQLAEPTETVCSIGFCAREQKWYGWSHRAIHGFGVGDEVKEGDCTATSGWTEDYLVDHPEADLSLPVGFVAHTLEDAKRMARAFAESVS